MRKINSDEREYLESLSFEFPCLVHHLKTIKITGFMKDLCESIVGGNYPTARAIEKLDKLINLVRFFLGNAKVLQKMTIHISEKPPFLAEKKWSKTKWLVAEKLITIPRASSNAQVLFS